MVCVDIFQYLSDVVDVSGLRIVYQSTTNLFLIFQELLIAPIMLRARAEEKVLLETIECRKGKRTVRCINSASSAARTILFSDRCLISPTLQKFEKIFHGAGSAFVGPKRKEEKERRENHVFEEEI